MPSTETLASYGYDPRSRRYRQLGTGRYIAEKTVRSAVDVVIDAETLTMRGHAQDLLDGKINFAEWQLRSLATLKALHVAVGLAGNGGKANTSPSDLAFIGNLLKEQYKYFRGMVADIRQGKQALDGTLLSRAALYGQAARGTHEDVRQRVAVNSGVTESRSVLGIADHCKGCVGEAAKGWVKVGTLIPIGERECGPNCRCTLEFR